MAETRPTGEQLRFISSATGDHILDTYLENSEKGGRTLPDLLSDIFESNGDFAAGNFEFRIEDSTRKYQVRVGVFANNATGWLDIPNAYLFRQRGAHTTATAYEQLDIITYNNNTYVCTVAHTSTTAAPNLSNFAIVIDGAPLTAAVNSATASASAAATSATNAANSATAAAASQSSASTSATNAANSATSASTSAATATTQASNSATSAAASAASASAAAASQSASAASQSAAAASASAAAASQSASATSASNAATSASSASSSASSASASAATATTEAANSAASAALANDWATKTSAPVAGGFYSAYYYAQQASSSATAASGSASTASAASTAAAAAQLAAENARDQTLAAYDSFDDRYLGAKTSDPALDNDGNALVAGSLYFNTSLGYMKVYTGSVWVDAYAAGTSFLAKASNLSDLPSVSTARTNLGLGTAATQNSTAFAAAVHTHVIADTTGLQTALDDKAPLANPALTGIPTAPTAAADTNTTQLATTAYVIGQASAVSPNMDGTASIGSSLKYARADHTHPTDTSRAPTASPTFTGTATLPSTTSIGSVTSTEISYLSGVTSSIQTQLNAKLDTSATTYVQQSGTTGSAYLPAGSTAQRPGTPAAGFIRYNTTTGKFEGYGSSWGNIGGGAAIGDTPPSNPGAGDLWWSSADGRMYVFYTDANSSQWVDLSAGGAGQYLPLTGGTVSGNMSVTGTVGVGTSTAGYGHLTVYGGSSYGTISILTGATGSSRLFFSDAQNTADEYDGFIQYDHSNRVMQFGTAQTERMRIDASGRVTMPYQPAFHATGPYTGGLWSVSASTGTGYVIIYTGILVNRGSHYNTSNGRFTAPVAGCYYFFASITAAGAYSGPQLYLRVNGAGQTGNVIAYTNTGYCTASGSWIVQLNAGDFVDCYWQANNMATAIDLSRAHFNGHLIG